jgi:hypothetical protein
VREEADLGRLLGVDRLHDVELHSERSIAKQQDVFIDVLFLFSVEERRSRELPQSGRFQSSGLPLFLPRNYSETKKRSRREVERGQPLC